MKFDQRLPSVLRRTGLVAGLAAALALPVSAAAPSAVPTAATDAWSASAQDDEEKPDKRPEIKELVNKLKAHAKSRGKEDQEAIATIDRLIQEFPNSGPKDRASIAKEIGNCLKQKRKPNKEGERDNKLFMASAVALGEMGPESLKPLETYIDHKDHEDDLQLQRALILSLGKTKLEDGIDTLTDLLVHHRATLQAAAAEALANFADIELKDRKKVFKEILDVLTAAKNQTDGDLNDTIARERYDVIAAPMITTLQVLSGHDERDPSLWRRWWNNNKKADWDEKGEDG